MAILIVFVIFYRPLLQESSPTSVFHMIHPSYHMNFYISCKSGNILDWVMGCDVLVYVWYEFGQILSVHTKLISVELCADIQADYFHAKLFALVEH